MIFPPLPTLGETPWHAKRAAWDAAVESGLNAVESSASAAAAREYWGPGRPDVAGSLDSAGTAWVAAAATGAVFRTTSARAAVQGAMVWRKEGTAWEVLEGDTGWLQISKWDAAGAVTGQALSAAWGPVASADGSIFVRRTADAVMVAMERLQKLGTTPNTVFASYTLPVGFRPALASGALGLADVGVMLTASGGLQRLEGAAAGPNGPLTGTSFALVIQGVPAPAWPTAYPPTV